MLNYPRGKSLIFPLGIAKNNQICQLARIKLSPEGAYLVAKAVKGRFLYKRHFSLIMDEICAVSFFPEGNIKYNLILHQTADTNFLQIYHKLFEKFLSRQEDILVLSELQELLGVGRGNPNAAMLVICSLGSMLRPY